MADITEGEETLLPNGLRAWAIDISTRVGEALGHIYAQVFDIVDSPTRQLGEVSITDQPISIQEPVTIDDGGGSITVDDGGRTLGVDDNDGSLTVDQEYHDMLNVNANLQVDNRDVSVLNIVPTGLPANDSDCYNVTLTTQNTEYEQVLPQGCRYFEFQCRTENDIRFAFEAGRVGPPAAAYMTLRAGDWYYSYVVDPSLTTPFTIYFGSATAAVVVEILAWT